MPQLDLEASGSKERYLHGSYGGLQVFIYLDQAEIKSPHLQFSGEWQDYDNPQLLLGDFRKILEQLAAV